MTQQDNHLMFRVGQIHTMASQSLDLMKEMHGRICANPEAPASKSWFGKNTLIAFGQALPRVIVPIAWPYLLAFLTWVGAMIVLGYKIALRFFVGS